MTKTQDLLLESFGTLGIYIALTLTSAVIGILMAFPLKWSWNYVMPYLFSLPVLTWGKAWCLAFICRCLLKSQLITRKVG